MVIISDARGNWYAEASVSITKLNGLKSTVFNPERTEKSFVRVSQSRANTGFPTYLYSWKRGRPRAVWVLEWNKYYFPKSLLIYPEVQVATYGLFT